MNSNTSGDAVGNSGFWPRSILPFVIDSITTVWHQLEALEDGTQLPGAVDFSEKAANDKIPDAVMAEIVRRLVVTVEKQQQGNVLFQPTPPDDITKAWMPTDAITGLPLDGKIKVWDAGTSAWVLADVQGGYTPPRKRAFKARVAAGASTVNFPFTDIETVNYFVSLVFTTQNADDTWSAAPGSYPANFGYIIVNKTNTLVSIAFYGVPVGGFMADGFVEEILP